jgi:hypothetical protein
MRKENYSNFRTNIVFKIDFKIGKGRNDTILLDTYEGRVKDLIWGAPSIQIYKLGVRNDPENMTKTNPKIIIL